LGAIESMDMHIETSFSDYDIANVRNIDNLLEKFGVAYAQAKDSQGNTPLHTLLYSIQPSFLQSYESEKNKIYLLLQHGASLIAQNDEGQTPIHIGVQCPMLSSIIVPFLHTISPDSIDKVKNKEGYTPLDLAILYYTIHRNDNFVDLLIHDNVRLCPEAQRQLNIHKNAYDGRYPLVKLAYMHNPTLLNTVQYQMDNFYHLTPLNAAAMGLVYCIEKKHYKTIAFLLEKRASVSIPDVQGTLPLHYAAEHGSQDAHDVLKMLLDYAGSCINIQNYNGDTPLHKAAQGNYTSNESILVQHARLLVQRNACLDRQNSEGKTALHDAVYNGRKHMVSFLLDAGASCAIADKQGKLPLHIAVTGTENIVNVLLLALEKYPPYCINYKDNQGNTPLHIVVAKSIKADIDIPRYTNIVRTLLLQKADVTISNNKGFLPIDLAQRCPNEIAVLLRRGIESYKKVRAHNAAFLKKAALAFGLDYKAMKVHSAYQDLLDFGELHT
jgi:ankyrin repeat protein